MRLSAFLLVAASTAAIAPALGAQVQPPAQTQASGPILTLEEAVQLAVRNNPTYLTALSARSRAGTQLRAAYGALLPQVNSSFGTSFSKGGPIVFEGQRIGENPDQISSSYNISANLSVSGRSLLGTRVAKAQLDASEADVRSQEAVLRSRIVTEYLNALQAQARAALQDTLLASAQTQLELNRAREQVGAGTTLDVRNAEVTVGQRRVGLLQQRNQAEIALLTLFQQIGVPKPEGVRLVTTFPIAEPTLQLNELFAMARQSNPALLSARARESAANTNVSSARSSWIPTLGISTGWRGFTQQATDVEPQIASAQAQTANQRRSCLTSDSIRTGAGLAPLGNCDRFVFTDADAAVLRAENDQYPFNFQKQPFGYSIGLSLPIFDGFRREQQIQDASASRNDARYELRRQELQMTTDITTAYRNLITQYEQVKVQEQTKAASQQAFELAQERYRVGASNFLEV
ncbi:MAG TPA: TolC family protein, partial [Gemmatimonadaceae bacterium]|nr:TolC family protein [Gemmatimonadaceae bacterium]